MATEGVAAAYDRWAPVYDMVFGKVFTTGRRESIEAAVYRASPLPPPPDPSLFERDLQVRFVPAD